MLLGGVSVLLSASLSLSPAAQGHVSVSFLNPDSLLMA